MTYPLFLSALREKKAGHDVPCWFMRQAGRYLPEYLEVRASTKNFMSFCYDVDKAAKVTLQPIDRFDMDAAIVFSDILVVLDAIGLDVSFKPNHGPIVDGFNNDHIDHYNFNKDAIAPCYKVVSKVRNLLADDKALIGFAGSPWTLTTYAIEGGSSKDFSKVKSFGYQNLKAMDRFLHILAQGVVKHLSAQIEAGAQAVQIFDSWAGVLHGKFFDRWVIEPNQYIVDQIKANYPDIPVIGFPKGAGLKYKNYVEHVNVDAVSIDQFTDLQWASDHLDVTLQGNLDPIMLYANQDMLAREIDTIYEILVNHPKGGIFNLGHGMTPKTPIDNVDYMVKRIKGRRL